MNCNPEEDGGVKDKPNSRDAIKSAVLIHLGCLVDVVYITYIRASGGGRLLLYQPQIPIKHGVVPSPSLRHLLTVLRP